MSALDRLERCTHLIPEGTTEVVSEVVLERIAQHAKQKSPPSTLTEAWMNLLYAAIEEVRFQNDPPQRRAELVRAAAVCVAWAEAITRGGTSDVDDRED